MSGRVALIACCIAGLLLAGARGGVAVQPAAPSGGDTKQQQAAPLRVVVSIAPLRGLVEPILKEAAIPGSVDVLIPPGRSEHGYEYPPSKLARLESADLIVLVGLGLETPVQKFLAGLPPRAGGEGARSRRVVVFADAIGEAAAPEGDEPGEPVHEHEHEHEHGEACEHDHHGTDPHLWLDPVLVERFVGVLTQQLAEAVGDGTPAAARVRVAGEALRKRVLAVHEEYALACGGFPTKTIVVGHDAWGRLAARYGLETVAIAGLTATEPTPKALEAAASAVKSRGLKVIFVEPQLSDRAGRMLAAATRAEIRKLDPLGDGDWFAMMNGNLRELKRALGAGQAGSAPAKQPKD